jgi:hypothetical protein
LKRKEGKSTEGEDVEKEKKTKDRNKLKKDDKYILWRGA